MPWVNSRLLVLQKLTYVYTGGAHGMEHQEFLVVDRSKSRAIGLSDLFTEGSADSLGVLLTAKLQQQAGVQQGESLTSKGYFVDTVPVAGNFFCILQVSPFTTTATNWPPMRLGIPPSPFRFGKSRIC